ncbi:hypothetical protein [Rickettsia prowazekii]|uniref:Uncharacterized protein n=1 Tax=Rickettsia prowazekii (strain Rp22) TaxID=449216 RepID=D5AXG8_RICPP|nr:hypothetical protein [Rickettsia prowazekii]EOB09945.1 Protein MraZ [Rickettsia prowazekii str. GvF12]EOB10899.1 Sodium/pantothenate symporter [Rickettsia prowazekii str. Cairo 3]ADE30107.1 hypothetical protein rpr22_0598 [Rickettsia prowazekii str. Rp22]AGJ01777.1 Sodium/pantothenate symporter [Rickettsia prowazekii str. NMRC Madrid E]AGJ02270.1 Sodium/pantothenate symporter [Rickettsia prowazekii str. Breinl]
MIKLNETNQVNQLRIPILNKIHSTKIIDKLDKSIVNLVGYNPQKQMPKL